MVTHLVWFRRDLRVTDNKALYAACLDPAVKVIALFIATPTQWLSHDMSARQATFLFTHLQQLQISLAELHIPLYYHQCDNFTTAVEWLVSFCFQHRVDKLFYNAQYEFNERRRDSTVLARLAGCVVCQEFNDNLLLPPGSILTNNDEMYKVYTPFRSAFIQRLLMTDITSVPAPKVRFGCVYPALLPIEPFNYIFAEVDFNLFPVGEQAARHRLRNFCQQKLSDYAKHRDLPALAGTSSLSPYLALGILSPRQCINRLRVESPNVLDNPTSGAFTWFSELIWREFYYHLMVAYPHLCQHRSFIPWTENVRWNNSQQCLRAWQQGQTGYPIVDAAMRQLNQTGWMHNRLRMISASFLVKDLLIDWRVGEHYFMSQLLDGDLAANNGGWQWVASTGVDAAPYFRIMNPTIQGMRFDAKGEFIRRWVPELAMASDSDIHQPLAWVERQQLNYPSPVVCHKQARLNVLAAFETARQKII